MANFTGLAAGRQHVLTQAGWNLDRDGLTGGPKVTVLVGEDRHTTIDVSLRYLGLGAPTPVAADEQGRIRPDALAAAVAEVDGPLIVALQAGNLHSGSFDPFAECIEIAHDAGAWVHVDGAFGLWAAATPGLRHLVAGMDQADSWGTDAHKTLNTPFDCGIAIVRDPVVRRATFGIHASYLINARTRATRWTGCRRCRGGPAGVPVWAALRSLGRSGVADLVDGLAANASRHRRGHRRRTGGRDPQRRRLHPGVGGVRLGRRADPRGDRGADRRRHRVDVRLALGRPRRAAGLGEQLVHRRRRRRGQRRRRPPRRRRT